MLIFLKHYEHAVRECRALLRHQQKEEDERQLVNRDRKKLAAKPSAVLSVARKQNNGLDRIGRELMRIGLVWIEREHREKHLIRECPHAHSNTQTRAEEQRNSPHWGSGPSGQGRDGTTHGASSSQCSLFRSPTPPFSETMPTPLASLKKEK